MPDETSTNEKGLTIKLPSSIDESAKVLLKPPAAELGDFFADLLYMVTGKVHLSAAKKRLENEHKLQQFKVELQQTVESKEPQYLTEPKQQVVGQALAQVQYCLDEENLREMFKNLIANAADSRYSPMIHPSFSTMITQMSPLDAQNLSLFKGDDALPVAEYRYDMQDGSYHCAFTHVFLANPNVVEDNFCDLQSASLSSLEHQGLVEIKYGSYLADKDAYKAFEELPLYKEMKKRVVPYDENVRGDEAPPRIVGVSITRGMVSLTPLGHAFVKVCFEN